MMNWKELVGTVAPTLGTALGGPFGGMAGKWLSEKLGVDEAELEGTVANSNSETMLKIKELETGFKLEVKRLGLQESQLHAESQANARNMAINTTLLPQAIIASVFIIGFIVVLYLVFSGGVKLEGTQANLANILLGILSAGIMQIMNFFFGSSAGSKEKTMQFNAAIKGN